jgi:hypothetical protein
LEDHEMNDDALQQRPANLQIQQPIKLLQQKQSRSYVKGGIFLNHDSDADRMDVDVDVEADTAMQQQWQYHFYNHLQRRHFDAVKQGGNGDEHLLSVIPVATMENDAVAFTRFLNSAFHELDEHTRVSCHQLHFSPTQLFPHELTQTTFIIATHMRRNIDLQIAKIRKLSFQEQRHLSLFADTVENAIHLMGDNDRLMSTPTSTIQQQQHLLWELQSMLLQPNFAISRLQLGSSCQFYVSQQIVALPRMNDTLIQDENQDLDEDEAIQGIVVQIIALRDTISFALNGQTYIPTATNPMKLIASNVYKDEDEIAYEYELKYLRRQHDENEKGRLFTELSRLQYERGQYLRAVFRDTAKRARQRWLAQQMHESILRYKQKLSDDEEYRRGRAEMRRKMEFRRFIEGQRILERAVLLVSIYVDKSATINIEITKKKQSEVKWTE